MMSPIKRRKFIAKAFSGSALLGGLSALPGQEAQKPAREREAEVFIERAVPGKPHAGKVLAIIEPHLDDGPIFVGGTVAKLLNEGYTGYLIRTSNDEKDSWDLTLGETVLANERDTKVFVKTMGLKDVFDLGNRNHRMDDISRLELRGRLIFLIRLLKVDTIFSYDPWGHYEENPDHYVTASAVEAACTFADGRLDYTEHFAAGLKPQRVKEKYYFARGPQVVNRVVDISTTIEQKLAAIRTCKTMIYHMVRRLEADLAQRNLRLPMLSEDEDAAIRTFIALQFRDAAARVGQKYGLQYAEAFHYFGPESAYYMGSALDEFTKKNAVPLR
jgi:LmbE family N-acetylglucosaminyl deacetylase